VFTEQNLQYKIIHYSLNRPNTIYNTWEGC